MDSKIKALEKAKECVNINKSFVMEGGAGSGKTETLKDILLFISNKHSDKKVVCITHTNKAVEEIKERVGNNYVINTVHSFIYSLIKDFKKNIQYVFNDLFKIPLMERDKTSDPNNNEYKKQEHVKYKNIFKKYNDMLYLIKDEYNDKVGKREYDKDPVFYNEILIIFSSVS